MKIAYEDLKKSNSSFVAKFKDAFNKTLESGWYILGEQVNYFENEFASYNDSNFCIGVASGLDAMILSLLSCDFPKKSEIIVPSNTYIATILAIHQAGLIPILVEPDIRTYNINPEKIEEKISPKTVGIMVVHLYGKLCDMDKISNLCSHYNLKLFEDCAQAHGASLNGKKAGTFGDFGCFSFYPTKNLGALGDAGAILCKSEEHNHRLRALRNYGSQKKYINDFIGLNSRLDEIQAAFLRIKLKNLNKITNHKQSLAKIYFNTLDDDKFILPVQRKEFDDVFHIFNIRHKNRDEIKKYLYDAGIGTEIHYPVPPQNQKAFQNIISETSFPISEEIHKTTLSLPISYAHTEQEIRFVAEKLNEYE